VFKIDISTQGPEISLDQVLTASTRLLVLTLLSAVATKTWYLLEPLMFVEAFIPCGVNRFANSSDLQIRTSEVKGIGTWFQRVTITTDSLTLLCKHYKPWRMVLWSWM